MNNIAGRTATPSLRSQCQRRGLLRSAALYSGIILCMLTFCLSRAAAQAVVGASCSTADCTSTHAFLWSNSAMQDLGTLGGANSFAYSINTAGQIVGQAEIASGT